MPGRNGTGPMGQGAMSGRGRGWCGATSMQDQFPPRGLGRGLGGGGGWRHRYWFHATGLTGWQRAQMNWNGPGAQLAVATEEELTVLKEKAASLEQTLGYLKSRIQKLEKPSPDPLEKEHE